MFLIWAGSAWLLGLVLASSSSLALWHWLILALSSIISGITFRNDRRFRILFTLLGILFLGAARWVAANPRIDPDHVAFYADTSSPVQITGQISADPEVLDNQTRIELETERIWIPALGVQKKIQGSILIRTSAVRNYHYGERLRVTGLLEIPPESGDFSYRAYLSRQDILAWMPEAQIRSLGMGRANPLFDLLYRLRGAAWVEIQRLFPFPEAPLISGILLGIESHIPDALADAYRATGTTHIIAISGFNITIIAGLTIAILGRMFGRVRGLIIAGLVIMLYTLFVGGDAAVVRAAIMGLLALAARYSGRRTHGLTSLAAAALIMTLADPRAIQDVGFQLSFFATLGLILYAEPLSEISVSFLRYSLPGLNVELWGSVIAELLLFTLAAQVTTLPILAWHFNQISITSLIANALILPLQPLLMILSGLATIFGLIWHALGQAIAWFAWPFSALTNRLVTLLAAVPGGVIYTGTIHPGSLLGYYISLFLATAGLGSSLTQRLVERLKTFLADRKLVSSSSGLLIMTIASLMVWQAYTRRPDGLLHVIILNVGWGESVLLRTPSGGIVLANGGSSPVRLGAELGRHLPYPNRRIDWLLVAGSQYEQIAGLREITSMAQIDQVLISGSGEGASYRSLFDRVLTAQIPVRRAEQGQQLDLGDGALLEVITLGPNGMTLMISHGIARIYLPLGLTPGELDDVLIGGRTANLTAALLADGGYDAVNPAALLSHMNPRVILISCQAGECPERFDDGAGREDYVFLTTDRYGAIELTSDGETLWITTEFNPEVTRSAADPVGSVSE